MCASRSVTQSWVPTPFVKAYKYGESWPTWYESLGSIILSTVLPTQLIREMGRGFAISPLLGMGTVTCVFHVTGTRPDRSDVLQSSNSFSSALGPSLEMREYTTPSLPGAVFCPVFCAPLNSVLVKGVSMGDCWTHALRTCSCLSSCRSDSACVISWGIVQGAALETNSAANLFASVFGQVTGAGLSCFLPATRLNHLHISESEVLADISRHHVSHFSARSSCSRSLTVVATSLSVARVCCVQL